MGRGGKQETKVSRDWSGQSMCIHGWTDTMKLVCPVHRHLSKREEARVYICKHHGCGYIKIKRIYNSRSLLEINLAKSMIPE